MLSHSILNSVYNELKMKVEKQFEMAKFVCISTDMWTSLNNKSYYAITYRWKYWAEIIFNIYAYKYLRSASSLILPHPSTIKTICNTFLSNPTDEDRNLFLKHARNVFKFLESHEKNVLLLMDEIHIQPYLDYKGGNIVGFANNNQSLCTSAYTFMISSVTSKLREVIHIFPATAIKSNVLFNCIKAVITKLEDNGYTVFCVISDNNSLNGKTIRNFSLKKELSIVYSHPCDNIRPIFFLYDSVHLIKCIRNNWLNSKPNKTFTYPDFETGEIRNANFNSLILLHRLEQDKLLKRGYSLSLKALFPSNLERQNVNLALKIFNPFIKEAFLTFLEQT